MANLSTICIILFSLFCGINNSAKKSSGGLDECGDQSPCLGTTFTSNGGGGYSVCIYWDKNKAGCDKSGTISHACTSRNEGDKTEGWRSGVNNALCQDVPCGTMAEFGVKDGNGCASFGGGTFSDDNGDCTFDQGTGFCHSDSTDSCKWSIAAPACVEPVVTPSPVTPETPAPVEPVVVTPSPVEPVVTPSPVTPVTPAPVEPVDPGCDSTTAGEGGCCNGFEGLQCEGGLDCIDTISDGCDMGVDGDCMGVCTGCYCVEVYQPLCCSGADYSSSCRAACDGYSCTEDCTAGECVYDAQSVIGVNDAQKVTNTNNHNNVDILSDLVAIGWKNILIISFIAVTIFAVIQFAIKWTFNIRLSSNSNGYGKVQNKQIDDVHDAHNEEQPINQI